MHLRDFGALLWGLIVIVGVVSSMIKAAGKAKAPASARLAEPQTPSPKPSRAPAPRGPVVANAAIAASLAVADAAYRTMLATPVQPPAPPPAFEPAEQTEAIAGIEAFAELSSAEPAKPVPLRGRRYDWARGVVIAELLAPPLAMRESAPRTW